MSKVESVATEFVREINESAGASVHSIVLYGSSLTDDFVEEHSDYNFLVVLSDTSRTVLDPLSHRARRWHKQRISTPIVVDPGFLPSAVDSYPIEILSMKARYRVLAGQDVLAVLSPEAGDVRLQCERELRGKLLHLRRGYIDAEGRADDLLRVLQRGHASFVALLRGLLYLNGGQWDHFGESFDRSCTERLGVSYQMLARVRAQRFAKKPKEAGQLASDYAELLSAVERLTLEADHWTSNR